MIEIATSDAQPKRAPRAGGLLARLAPRRIAVFRALQLGDLLCAVPALRALRHACPHARITLIGLPWAQDFVLRLPHLDDFLEFPGAPGLPEREPVADALPRFYAAARERRFDLALQLHGSGELTNPIVEALQARCNAGFAAPSEHRDPERYIAWPEGLTEVHRLLALVDHLGAPACGTALELPVLPHERAAADELRYAHRLRRRRYACVHPGARLASRRWWPERFAAVADAISARGYTPVLTGTADDAPAIAAVQAAARRPLLDFSGRTSLGTLAALVADARLVVCNDTGMSHVAAAQRTPSVVTSSGADARRWAPLDRARHRVLWHAVPCRPCAHERCPTGHECAAGVTVDAVLHSVAQLLQQEVEFVTA